MALLAGTLYDPAVAVNNVTTSNIAMTALDTTNLRLTFTVPPPGAVLVHMRGVIHGATTTPQIFLGVMEGATIKGRVAPLFATKAGGATATMRSTADALFIVSGLTVGASLTWDAAYGVDAVAASTGLKYGGPNDTTTDNAYGGFSFEIWEAPNLLAAALYDPAALVTTKVLTSLLAMTAVDTTNLRLTFTGPPSGKVQVRVYGNVIRGFPVAQILLGCMDGATVKGRQSGAGGYYDTTGVTNREPQEASFLVTGLTPGTSYTWDAAYGVEIVSGGTTGLLAYGGPNDTTSDNAAGAFGFEIWAA